MKETPKLELQHNNLMVFGGEEKSLNVILELRIEDKSKYPFRVAREPYL